MAGMTAEPPLVSIAVPAYNAEQYLRQSLDSIVAQTYRNREILVMDDASTDNTAAIVRSYGSRVVHIRQKENRGQFANVNSGIARARGKYIAVYHADDVYEPTIVEREVAYLESHAEVGAVFCLDRFIDGNGRVFGQLQLPAGIPGGQPLDYRTVLNAQLLYKNRFIRTPGSMVRAAVYREAGPYRGREYPVAADLEMFLRIARSHPIAILDEYLLNYRWGHAGADRRDRLLRTAEEAFFAIVGEHLAGGGGKLVTPAAAAAFAAHRNEDKLMRVVNLYILGRTGDSRRLLREVRAGSLLKTRQVRRARLVLLWLGLHLLTRTRRVKPVADLFFARWHSPAGGWARKAEGSL